MAKLTSLEEIEEFSLARRIPRSAISTKVTQGLRQLREIDHIEPYLRQIISDPTDTAHSATEIADILTTHVTVNHKPVLAAFVNKGKATRKVTSRAVAHQYFKIRQISGLDLMVLAASGDIQDDAVRDWTKNATDADVDYCVIDGIDLARIFIAYQKICPNDGSPFQNGTCVDCGTSADMPVELTIKVHEELRYTILEHQDISRANARRYSAHVYASPHYSKATIRELVKVVTWQLRNDTYSRSEVVELTLGDRPADVVVTYIYTDPGDRQQTNWLCRSQWIRPDLSSDARPMAWNYDEEIGEIGLSWNNHHGMMRDFTKRATKREWTLKVRELLPQVAKLHARVVEHVASYRRGSLSEEGFSMKMAEMERAADELTRLVGNIHLPPYDVESCDVALVALAGTLHNSVVPFASWGRKNQSISAKLRSLDTYLEMYQEDLQKFELEWGNLK